VTGALGEENLGVCAIRLTALVIRKRGREKEIPMKLGIRVAAASSLLALATLGLIACGGDDEDGTTQATVSPETTMEAQVPPNTTLPPKPSPELVRALRRDANTWVSLFAVRGCNNKYMGVPMCKRWPGVGRVSEVVRRRDGRGHRAQVHRAGRSAGRLYLPSGCHLLE
jgi:hypothetical protein